MTQPISLESCVGKTFERDGERCYVVFTHVGDWNYASIRWAFPDETDIDYQMPVPPSMLKTWLAGAVEVEGQP